jgi:hypothetical protein
MSTEPCVDLNNKAAVEAPKDDAEARKDTEDPPKKRKPKADKGEPKAKRGPARPHRRLATEIIDERIAKLQKRYNRRIEACNHGETAACSEASQISGEIEALRAER